MAYIPQFARIKDFIVLLVITTLYLAITSAVVPGLPLPDIPLLVALYTGLKMASMEGAFLCFSLGYIEDVLTGGLLGSSSFALVTAYAAVVLVAKKVHFTTPGIRAAAGFGLGIMKGFLLYAIISSINSNVPFSGFVFIQALITGAFAPAVLTILERLRETYSPGLLEKQ